MLTKQPLSQKLSPRRLIAEFFADAKAPKPNRSGFLDHATSDLLTYRTYDPKEGLFYNADNYGFMLEVAPQGDADERAKALVGILNQSFDDTHSIQIINWSGPDIGPKLDKWVNGRRNRGPFVEHIAHARRDHIMKLRFGTDDTIPVVPHNRRAFVCVWHKGSDTQTDVAKLQKIKRDLINCFGGKSSVIECKPDHLLQLLSQVLHCKSPGGTYNGSYSENEFLNYQLPGSRLRVSDDCVELAGDPKLKVASATATRYPKDWKTTLNYMLSGDPLLATARPIGPVLTSFTARIVGSLAAKSFMNKKVTGVMKNQGTKMEKWMPDLADKNAEFQELNTDVENNMRMFDTTYTVNAYALEEHFENDPVKRVCSIYNAVGIHFADGDYLHLPSLMGSLPFGMHDDYLSDFQKAQRSKLLPATAIGVLSPVMGEYAGNKRFQGIPLIGRQNALFNWSNYDANANYNTSVVGKSGAGKSVFMQDLCLSIYAEGGRVIIVDNGRSFEGLADLLNGDFIAFGDDEEVQLNPFSLLDPERMADQGYFEEAIEMVSNFIGTMCSLDADYKSSRVGNLEEGFLGTAVQHAWNASQREATVQDVYDFLSNDEKLKTDPRVLDMLVKLERFTLGGEYGRYFDKGISLSIDSEFVVFEMAELDNKRTLRDLILHLIMFLSTEVMFKTSRSTKTALIIDEAWDLLDGSSTGAYVASVVRRARKYSGCLICGTQSVNDFFTNEAAKVIFENSDNFVCLQQNPAAIEQLANESKIDVDGFVNQQLKSLTKVPGRYTEMGIYTPDGWSFARHMLDPFSLGVFSTKGEYVALRQSYIDAGMSMQQAINHMIERGEVQ